MRGLCIKLPRLFIREGPHGTLQNGEAPAPHKMMKKALPGPELFEASSAVRGVRKQPGWVPVTMNPGPVRCQGSEMPKLFAACIAGDPLSGSGWLV